VDSNGRTIWITDAHRDNGKRFVVRADEKLTARRMTFFSRARRGVVELTMDNGEVSVRDLEALLPICTLSFGIIQDAQFEALRWQCGRSELIEASAMVFGNLSRCFTFSNGASTSDELIDKLSALGQ
jgi:hypothetical protein